MKTHLIACALASILLGGCATSSQPQAPLVLGRVGPSRPELVVPSNSGTLVVHSDWAVVQVGTDFETRHHRDFRILREDGSLLQQVRNAPFALFEDPALVSLPAGNYIVETVDSVQGRVQIPVQVVTNRTTTVCLTGEFDEPVRKLALSPEALVKLADGRIVGWSSK